MVLESATEPAHGLERAGDGEHGAAGSLPAAGLPEARGLKAGFNEYLLAAVVVLTLATVALGVAVYLLPGEYLQIPELQPAVRVARQSDFPVGASRVLNWGTRIVLVVRAGDQEYSALQGTSPIDGCILEWDAASLRVVSPCSYVVYDLHGNVVRGLTTVPLQRYAVFLRQGAVYVTEL
jgi:nitrite reductase/ring-hydroxylating ferredoxin subunit